jgi:hypothetical protein
MELDLMKSVTYIFDDPDWVMKLGIMLVVSLAGGALMFILVGLVFIAAQYGWMIELIRNMRAGDETPMPTWDNFGGKISLGGAPMGALVVYMLIPIILACVLYVPAIMASVANEDAGGIVGGATSCILFPLMVVYMAAAWVFFTVGTVRYASSESIGEYFKFSSLWATVQENRDLTIRYVIFVVIVGLVMGAIGGTGIGGLVTAAVSIPISGHLLGQYAIALDGGKKKKNA